MTEDGMASYSMDMNLSKLWELVMTGKPAVLQSTGSQTTEHDGATEMNRDHSVIFDIPYDYTVEVRNRFKGIDLIDRMPDELWMEFHDTVQEAVIKTTLKKKDMQKSKMAV